jgi:hypothetical protein
MQQTPVTVAKNDLSNPLKKFVERKKNSPKNEISPSPISQGESSSALGSKTSSYHHTQTAECMRASLPPPHSSPFA